MPNRKRYIPLATLVAVFGCLLILGAGSANSASHDQPHRDHDRGHWFKQTCADAAPGFASCNAQIVTDAAGSPLALPAAAVAYGPSQFATAYSLPTTAASAPTIGIVDAYDNPNIVSDLATFSTQYGLPSCPAGSCFTKVNQTGGTTYPSPNTGWGLEIALDVEVAHEICQNCKILLVEANSNSFADLAAAENEAVKLGANVISNSWGSNEFGGEAAYDSYFNHPGVVITASSGDSGYGVGYPAASPYVVAVGGTTLTLNGDNSYLSEAAWADGGSGCSTVEAKPAWQSGFGCSKRTVVDVSADADPNTGAAIYDTFGYSGWYRVGGTSLSAPLIAAVYALSGNTNTPAAPYANPGALHDVTSGSNSAAGCTPSYLCTAGTGYDGPTGLGTPNGVAAFTVAAPTPDFTLAATPASRSVTQGQGTSYSVTMTPNSAFGSNSVNVAVTGAPSGVLVSGCTTLTTSSPCTMTVTTGSDSPAGSYPLTLTGTGTGLPTHTATVTLVVTAPAPGDFSLSISPTSRTLRTPGSTTFTVTVNRLNGFTGSVTLGVSGLPTGFLAQPPSLRTPTTGTSSTLTITAPKTSRRTVTLTVTGTSGSLTHTKTATLSVR